MPHLSRPIHSAGPLPATRPLPASRPLPARMPRRLAPMPLAILASLLAGAASMAATTAADAATATGASPSATAPHTAAHGARSNDAIVRPVMTKDLPDIPGKQAIMATLEYLPGGKSLPHRHDADVFVYVLDGAFATQVAGQKKVILHKGQAFYESPTDIHEVSANASATKPVKLLILVIKDKNKPITMPAGDARR